MSLSIKYIPVYSKNIETEVQFFIHYFNLSYAGEMQLTDLIKGSLLKLDDNKELIKFCSVGHTIERGTVIMTGTPGGVAALMEPPAWLKHGDVVEVNIDGIGTLRNQMMFH